MNATETYILLTKKLDDFFEMSFCNFFDEERVYKGIIAEIREKCTPEEALKFERTRVDEFVARARIMNIFGLREDEVTAL